MGLRAFIHPSCIFPHGLFSPRRGGPDLTHRIYVSVFGGKNKPEVIQTAEGSWVDFRKLFSNPLPSSIPKDDLQLWSPTRFKNEYRDDDFVEEVYALTFDVDEQPIPSGLELQRLLKDSKTIVSTSSRATAEAPRWRVVLALSRPVTGEEYSRLWTAVTARFPFPVGKQSRNPGRAWFMPRHGTDDTYEVFETHGAPIDVDTWLAEVPTKAATPTATAVQGLSLAPNADRAAKLATAALILGNNWPGPGQRHVAQRALSGALYRENWSREAATEFLCAVCKHAGDENRSKRAQTTRDTWTTGEAGGQLEGWSTLRGLIDGGIVGSAQSLLARGDMARVAADLGVGAVGGLAVQPQALSTNNGQGAEVDSAGGGLGFEYGAWADEPPPVEFLVEGLIPTGSVSMWYGRADSLKTWLVYSLAIAVARGEPWLGRPTKAGCKAGIVDYETGKGNVKRRLYMLRAGTTQSLGTVAFAKLRPNNPDFWGELAKEGFDIVFIDSLRKANPGGDENDSDESIIPLTLAAEFSEVTGCAVVYIHHAKKATSDGWPEFRGSSGIEDQVDCAFAVRKCDTGTAKKTVDVKCVKPGDMRTPEDFTAEVEFNDSARTAVIRLGTAPTAAAKDTDTDARVQGAIRLALAEGPMVLLDIRKRVKGGNKRIGEEIKGMVDRGEVVRMDTRYALESPAYRQERVVQAIRKYAHWTASELAKAAYVQTAYVEELVRAGVICRRAEGEAGFLVVSRSE